MRKVKPRYYRLERNAIKRRDKLAAQWPDRSFFVAPTSCFRWAVYTGGAICA